MKKSAVAVMGYPNKPNNYRLNSNRNSHSEHISKKKRAK